MDNYIVTFDLRVMVTAFAILAMFIVHTNYLPFFQFKDLRIGESSPRFSLLVLLPPLLPLLRFQGPLQICEWCLHFIDIPIFTIATILVFQVY